MRPSVFLPGRGAGVCPGRPGSKPPAFPRPRRPDPGLDLGTPCSQDTASWPIQHRSPPEHPVRDPASREKDSISIRAVRKRGMKSPEKRCGSQAEQGLSGRGAKNRSTSALLLSAPSPRSNAWSDKRPEPCERAEGRWRGGRADARGRWSPRRTGLRRLPSRRDAGGRRRSFGRRGRLGSRQGRWRRRAKCRSPALRLSATILRAIGRKTQRAAAPCRTAAT